jgi:hypothetical protein
MTDVATYSVRAAELAQLEAARPITIAVYPSFSDLGTHDDVLSAQLLPRRNTKQRDRLLALSPYIEGTWAIAVHRAITKLTSRNFELSDVDESATRMRRSQQLLTNAGIQRAWVPFLTQLLQDFFLTDNGSFCEIVRAANSRYARIVGLMPLDSLQCTRTGDPDFPVIYTDMLGRDHVLRDYEVFDLVDQPSNRVRDFGIGMCAASRAWSAIHTLMSMKTYVNEKLTGKRPTAIHIVNGVSKDAIANALNETAAQRAQEGTTLYRGAVVINTIKPDAQLNKITIPLAEIPDGFDHAAIEDQCLRQYATAVGIPVQDLKPLSGQGLGTGTQTEVLDDAADLGLLATLVKQLEHAFNYKVLPTPTTVSFVTNDLREQELRAQIGNMRANERATRIASGELTVDEAVQLAAEYGDYPREWLIQDNIRAGTLTDSESSDVVDPDTQPANETETETAPPTNAPPV